MTVVHSLNGAESMPPQAWTFEQTAQRIKYVLIFPHAASRPATREALMAKGQMRQSKEKKKPKQDKNKKAKGATPSPFAAGQGQPGQNPYGKKGP